MKLILILTILPVMFFLLSCQNEKAPKLDTSENLSLLVKNEFLHAWKGYEKYAWGHDALKPLSKSYRDWYDESLYMTPVDAYDTMRLMGLNDEAQMAKDLVLGNLNFDKNFYVQNFEVTIRLLGGLISSYQLDGDQRFLDLAKDLGKRLLPVFGSPTGMPYTHINLKTGQVKGKISNPAEVGTLFLEFGMLTHLTGDSIYFKKSRRALTALYDHRSDIGLVGSLIDVETGKWTNQTSHISGGIDSYYEYLLKGSILFHDKELRLMFDSSLSALNEHAAEMHDTDLWYGQVNMETGFRISSQFGALDAFFPAVLALSGDTTTAAMLQISCYKMWMMYGIEPETINYKRMSVVSEPYVLRPENIESAYYLYHFTGDKKYLEMGKVYLNSIIKYCRVDDGYAALKSVVSKEHNDAMESFFLAETMKYLYLLFTPDAQDFNSVIYNTEAHPFKRYSN